MRPDVLESLGAQLGDFGLLRGTQCLGSFLLLRSVGRTIRGHNTREVFHQKQLE